MARFGRSRTRKSVPAYFSNFMLKADVSLSYPTSALNPFDTRFRNSHSTRTISTLLDRVLVSDDIPFCKAPHEALRIAS